MSYMGSFRSHDHLRKVCALLAATLILPALAYADKDGKDKDKGKDPGDKNSDRSRSKCSVGIGSFFWCSPVILFATVLQCQFG